MAAALFIGVASYWFPFVHILGSCSVGKYATGARLSVLLLLGTAGGVFGRKGLGIALAGAAGFLAGWFMDLFLSMVWSKVFTCSHQFLPFEAVFMLAYIAIPILLGFFAGKLLNLFVESKLRLSYRRPLACVLVVLSAGIAALSSALLPRELRANENRALELVRNMAHMQFAYRMNHPEIGFACELKKLSDTFEHTYPSYDRQGGGSDYEDAYAGGYHYRLWCYPDKFPRVEFVITANPFCTPDCGNVGYCVNHTGEIRALLRSESKYWGRDCCNRGTIVGFVTR